MGIDKAIILPRLQFLHEGAGLVTSALYGLLQSLQDKRFFALVPGFLGEDDRFDGHFLLHWGYILACGFCLGCRFLFVVVFEEVDHSVIVNVCYHDVVLKKAQTRGINSKVGKLVTNIPLAHAVTRVKGTYILFVTKSFADLPLRTMPSCAVRYYVLLFKVSE